MLTFDELVQFVKQENELCRKAKGRKALDKNLIEIERKVADMMKSFNDNLPKLDETDQKALRYMLTAKTRDMLSTFLCFMRTERGMKISDWH
ncbi:MAG TPA: hypothetical protein PLF31_00700 [Candidatus Paceibacterota bacterium]|nr:hypothetical protein [Candidatus Paceibacterota bacterium]